MLKQTLIKQYAILVVLLLLAACSLKAQSTGAVTAQSPIYPWDNQAKTPTIPWNGQVKEFTVRAFQYGFEPSTLEVNLGDKVVLHAYTSDVPHGLALWDYGVNMNLMDKTPVSQEFIADKAGEFTFMCSIPCGSGHSKMQGKLIVNGK